jgi:hypothetical protein
MRTGLVILAAFWLASNTPAAAETTRFVISRDGDRIGTSRIEIDRAGDDVTVSTATDLVVNVLFFTAYRFKQTRIEHWNNGHLVNLNATTDNNGTRHKVAVRSNGDQLQLTVNGQTSRLDNDIVPSTLWNPEFLRHSAMLDVQDGKVAPISVTDNGVDTLNLGGKEVQAHHYTFQARYSQGVWYNSEGRLVRVQVIGPDGSVILYTPTNSDGAADLGRMDRWPSPQIAATSVSSSARVDYEGPSIYRRHVVGASRCPLNVLVVAKLAGPCARIAPHMSDRGRSHTVAGQVLPALGIGPRFSRSGELS